MTFIPDLIVLAAFLVGGAIALAIFNRFVDQTKIGHELSSLAIAFAGGIAGIFAINLF